MKNLIVKVADAQKIVNEADASVLANMDIVTPDTVAVPIVYTQNTGSWRILLMLEMQLMFIKM